MSVYEDAAFSDGNPFLKCSFWENIKYFTRLSSHFYSKLAQVWLQYHHLDSKEWYLSGQELWISKLLFGDDES